MDISLPFVRILFMSLCILISISYVASTLDGGGFTVYNLMLAILGGGLFSCAVMALDLFVRKLNLRAFNTITLGLLFGVLLGLIVDHIFLHIFMFTGPKISTITADLIRVAIYLVSIYFGVVLTLRAADELYVCLPFVKFKSTALKKKDILLDASVLGDARLIDLASSGLVDNHLVIPRSILKELQSEAERDEDLAGNRARRCLEIVKKLESLPNLEIRYTDADIADIKSPQEKLVKLARVLDANILTAEINQLQQPATEDVRIIKFQQLCNSLKPLSQTGELINIKVQRYGKEPRQGVGYLDDGTMVVINGGAEFIGESIKAQVLSVKHTSSGRMIFCNTFEESLLSQSNDENGREEVGATTGTPIQSNDHHRYFTL